MSDEEKTKLHNSEQDLKPRVEMSSLQKDALIKIKTPDRSWDAKFQGVKWYKDRGLNMVYTDNDQGRKAMSLDQVNAYCQTPLGEKVSPTFKLFEEKKGEVTSGWMVASTPTLDDSGSLENKNFVLIKTWKAENGADMMSQKRVSASEFVSRNNIAVE